MRDKFMENFKMALPAAIATIIILIALSFSGDSPAGEVGDYDLVLMIPYLIVLIGGIIGINVFIVLAAGIISGALIMVLGGYVDAVDMLSMIGGGMSGMLETAMVAILVSAICALIAYNGGFEALLSWIRRTFKGKKGGMIGTGILVSAMDVATANNTVAIVIANPIAKDISKEYGFSSKKTASILDTFSCVMQGILPYGAQMLLAVAAVGAAGFTVSAFDIIPCLYYQFILLICVLLFIFVIPERKEEPVEA